jgi:hypothetical protein
MTHLKRHLILSMWTVVIAAFMGIAVIGYGVWGPQQDKQEATFWGFLLFASLGLFVIGGYATVLPLLEIWIRDKFQKIREHNEVH